MQECLKGRCLTSERGVCGGHRYVSTGDGYAGAIRYFDSNGRLIAATAWTDVGSFSRCEFWTHYGRPFTCKMEPLEKLR
jgi:hypothetical protein